MNRVYKYTFPTQDVFELALPIGARILKLGMSKGDPCVWVLVDPDKTQHEIHRFLIFGTGHDISDEELATLTYVDTYFEGPLVWHVFEVKS